MAINNSLKYCRRCGSKLKPQPDKESYLCPKCKSLYYKDSAPSVSVVLIDQKNRVLLTKRSIEPKRGMWGLPGGYLRNGEEPIRGAKREAKEEIGVDIKIEKLIRFTIEDNAYEPEKDAFVLNISFRGKIISGQPKARHENSVVGWFSKSEIPWRRIAFEGNKKAIKEVFESLSP